MKTITVKYGVDSITKQVEDDFTFGDLQESDSFKAALGFGDNTKALVDGIEQDRGTVIPAGSHRASGNGGQHQGVIINHQSGARFFNRRRAFLLFMENIETIIRQNGTLTERTIRERDLDAEQSVLDALTDEVTRSLRNVVSVPGWGLAHANVGLNDTIWSVPIDRIPLNARFRLINGVLVPVFASRTDLEMPLVWRAPKEVRLVFAVRTEFAEDCIKIDGNWLFAFDKDNRGYRLPLPNLHDDCLICTGNFEDLYDTAGEASGQPGAVPQVEVERGPDADD